MGKVWGNPILEGASLQGEVVSRTCPHHFRAVGSKILSYGGAVPIASRLVQGWRNLMRSARPALEARVAGRSDESKRGVRRDRRSARLAWPCLTSRQATRGERADGSTSAEVACGRSVRPPA
jgi:hypothetical protein